MLIPEAQLLEEVEVPQNSSAVARNEVLKIFWVESAPSANAAGMCAMCFSAMAPKLLWSVASPNPFMPSYIRFLGSSEENMGCRGEEFVGEFCG